MGNSKCKHFSSNLSGSIKTRKLLCPDCATPTKKKTPFKENFYTIFSVTSCFDAKYFSSSVK